VTEESDLTIGDDPLPIDLLADTIIGFLEKGTAFLRTVANQSFSLLSAHLERSTVELILTVGEIPSVISFWTQWWNTATGTKGPHSGG
jgi:hypothetical protein